jgi:hypothetical protein
MNGRRLNVAWYHTILLLSGLLFLLEMARYRMERKKHNRPSHMNNPFCSDEKTTAFLLCSRVMRCNNNNNIDKIW